jgi:hypothetical protein
MAPHALFLAHLGKGFVDMALDNPAFVLEALKFDKGFRQLLHDVEVSKQEQVWI